jgi:8-oxo-dGTP pyrophosphatase MutT (NUDIX family)
MTDMLLADLRLRLPQAPPQGVRRDDRPPGQGAGVPAAVLLPIVQRPRPSLLFTRRTERLARHGGQVSFPGGRSEAADLSPVETALRETMEETGIAPGLVTVAGYLGRHLTGTGFDIQPVVGLVRADFALAPDPREVAEVFEVPLAFLRDPANRVEETRHFGAFSRRVHAFRYEGHDIWGATAAIVIELVERLDAINAP